MSANLTVEIKVAPELLTILQKLVEALAPKTVNFQSPVISQSPAELAARQRMVQAPAPAPVPQQAAPTYASIPAAPVAPQQYQQVPQQAPVNPMISAQPATNQISVPVMTAQAVPSQRAVPGAKNAPQPAVTPSNPAPVAAAPAYTMDDLARAASALMDAGKQQQLVGLLGQFGVQALTQLPKERYGEFATALRGLGARI